MSTKLLTDALTRKKWVGEGLLQAQSKSFWAPFTGNSANSIVYRSSNISASSGHTTTFDYSGNLSGVVIRGKDTAYGKGETKKKFSSTIIVDRFRLPVDNGDKFDGVEFGDLGISQHSNSRSLLSDVYIRFKDQMLFDAAQGNLRSRTDGSVFSPSHIIQPTGNKFTYNGLLEIEASLKSSTSFSTGGMRRPLQPFKLQDGRPCWLMAVDTPAALQIKLDPRYQDLMAQGDIRGNNNRIINGVIGKIGNLIIVEADSFFGSTKPGADWKIEDSGIEIAGLRVKDSNDVWTGQEGFNPLLASTSRSLILGAGALQQGFGKMPDYKWQPSNDFGITSESALEVWMNVQKTKLIKENEDYQMGKVTDIDWGVIVVETQNAAA